MKRIILLSLLFFSCSYVLFAQKQEVSGVVTDAYLGETVVGANVIVKGTYTGAVTDINGRFSLMLDPGKYTLQVSYVGYEPATADIEVKDQPVDLNFSLKTIELDEVAIVADVARARQTPVAFSTILPAKIEEQLAGQDIPMLLNKTPGVYATEQGGGDGDARITIRGFSQRNVAVMLDGIPVNDMENGWVYWSNWFGLDAVTRSIQVQRGLGASKLALPSVGGTMNILTKGIDVNRSLSIEEAVDNEGKSITTLGYNSGRLNHGWGLTLAGAFKKGNSWVEETDVTAWFFYTKVDKMWGKHITSITAYGAPQTHVQRSYKRAIATYDTTYAKEHGVSPEDFPWEFADDNINSRGIMDQGVGYNQHWGYIRRNAEVWNSDTTARIIDPNASKEVLHEKVNTYFKPMFSIRDIWNVNDRLSISNVVYLSIGTGGGQGTRKSLKNPNLLSPSEVNSAPDVYGPDEIGQINWQSMYDQNTKIVQGPWGTHAPIDSTYSDKLYYSTNYLVQSNNNHIWYGLLSSFNYKLSDKFDLSGGVDLRSYKAEHYMEIVDLLGGDYAVDENDLRITKPEYIENPQLAVKHVGDKVYYYDAGLVKWGGVFSQLEYKSGNLSTFVNLTASVTGIKKNDYFGNLNSDWKYKPGFTFKTGANYNFTEHSNVFINLGYLSKTRDYKYYFQGYTANFQPDSITKNEKVKAIELGYSYNSRRFSANINAYYTGWLNKPLEGKVKGIYTDGETEGTVPGIDALHRGIEIDFIYKLARNLDLQGLLSLGDWIWNKKVENVQMYYSSGTFANEKANQITFDATGIHVGDAAQTQVGGSIRYEPIKRMYIEAGGTYFARYYADFNPTECTDSLGNPVESWKMPNYLLFDLHSGYNFKIKPLDKFNFTVRLNVLNLLNTVYITDALNNDTYIQRQFGTYDARSASVFMGAPRRISVSLKIMFF